MSAPERIMLNKLTGAAMEGQDAFGNGVEYVRADLSALAAVAMREAAFQTNMELSDISRKFGDMNSVRSLISAAEAIRALPIPDHTALLRAALELPEVRAVVGELKYIVDGLAIDPPLYEIDPDEDWEWADSRWARDTVKRICAALAALEGKQ